MASQSGLAKKQDKLCMKFVLKTQPTNPPLPTQSAYKINLHFMQLIYPIRQSSVICLGVLALSHCSSVRNNLPNDAYSVKPWIINLS